MSSDPERPVLHDLSPPITPELGVWPGDTAASREVLADLSVGDNLTLSTLRTTVHVGAHADAPSHTDDQGASIDAVALDAYVGPCQVMRVDARPGRPVDIADLDDTVVCPRLLVATGTFPDPRVFNEDFAAIEPRLIDHLATRGVRLLGTDAPSVDPFASKDLPAHGRLVHHGMAVLEGLVLTGVAAGSYELVALPLALSGFDASPVRAVLRQLP